MSATSFNAHVKPATPALFRSVIRGNPAIPPDERHTLEPASHDFMKFREDIGMTTIPTRAFRATCLPLIAAAMLPSLTQTASAQWTVTNLHPAGATYSQSDGTSGTQQTGYAKIGGIFRASLWSGTPASRIDLHPAASTASYAFGISTAQQTAHQRGRI